jgi:hypothetical protein
VAISGEGGVVNRGGRDCVKMGERNGWDLIDIRPNGDRILSVDCVFDGEQTSFEDERYE